MKKNTIDESQPITNPPTPIRLPVLPVNPAAYLIRPLEDGGETAKGFFQCFKTQDLKVYCSSIQFKNHDEGNAWIKDCLKAHNLQGSDVLGRPFTADSPPDRAILWP